MTVNGIETEDPARNGRAEPRPRRAAIPDPHRFADLTFSADLSGARRGDGAVLTFTRGERRVLADLIAHPGMLRSRSQLLDAMSEPSSDASERNVDFVVNRLRAKLGDSAREPTYIATRYGEGYVWVAPRARVVGEAAGAFLVVGPLRGLAGLGHPSEPALALAAALADGFGRDLADNLRVALDPDAPEPMSLGEAAPDYQIEMTFLEIDGRLDCVSVLRRCRGGRILKARRDLGVSSALAPTLVADLAPALWLSMAEAGPASPDLEPMEVRLYEAGAPFARPEPGRLPPEADQYDEAFPIEETWRRNEAHLRRLIAEGEGGPVVRLMLATNIQSRYITNGWQFLAESDSRRADEAEMERLVVEVLPELQADPQHALSAAKVLLFLGPPYRRIAVDLAEDGFRRSTGLAHALSIHGSIQCFIGDFERGLGLLRQARRLARPGSLFERYIVATLCIHLMASGDFDGVNRHLALLTRSPVARGAYGLIFGEPDRTTLPLVVRLWLPLLSAKSARALLLWSYYTGARLFSDPDARDNTILGLGRALRRRFGDGVVLPEIAAAVPRIMTPPGT